MNAIGSFFAQYFQSFPEFLLRLPVILLALTVHECAHGYVAYLCGDPTARNLGRLTLNPLKHLDPLGALVMLFFHFGWAKPVPVNSRYFRKPKRDMALVAFAGPISNLLMGFFGCLFEKVFMKIMVVSGALVSSGGTLYLTSDNQFLANLIGYTDTLFYLFFLLNVSLAVFNLIPIPPLDGSRILFIFLPSKYYFGLMKYERYIQIALLLALWTGLLTTPLSYLVSLLAGGMNRFLSLFPFLSI